MVNGWLSNRGIQLRSGTRQEFRFSQLFESLDDPLRRDLQLPLQNWPLDALKSLGAMLKKVEKNLLDIGVVCRYSDTPGRDGLRFVRILLRVWLHVFRN